MLLARVLGGGFLDLGSEVTLDEMIQRGEATQPQML